MIKQWWSYLPILVWTAIIIELSTGPGVQIPFEWEDVIGVDKFAHAAFYGFHTILLLWTFRKNQHFTILKKALIAAFLISTILGIAMEIVQFSFYPNRYFEILDIIANIIGSFLGTIFFKYFKPL